MARKSIGYVVRGIQIGGVRLDSPVPPSADEIARAFLSSVLERSASILLPLDNESECTIRHWLGITP